MTNLLAGVASPLLGGLLARVLLSRDLENPSLIDPFYLHKLFDNLQRRLPFSRGILAHCHIMLDYCLAGQEIQKCAHGGGVI